MRFLRYFSNPTGTPHFGWYVHMTFWPLYIVPALYYVDFCRDFESGASSFRKKNLLAHEQTRRLMPPSVTFRYNSLSCRAFFFVSVFCLADKVLGFFVFNLTFALFTSENPQPNLFQKNSLRFPQYFNFDDRITDVLLASHTSHLQGSLLCVSLNEIKWSKVTKHTKKRWLFFLWLSDCSCMTQTWCYVKFSPNSRLE